MAELLLLEESQDKKLNKQDERLASFILEHSAEEYEELLRKQIGIHFTDEFFKGKYSQLVFLSWKTARYCS